MSLPLPHLVRRFFQSLDNRPLSESETRYASDVLNVEEFRLWTQLQNRDQRHSLLVLRRFDEFLPNADINERRAALLHDIGKIGSPGLVARVVATVVGGRTQDLDRYLRHEEIGLELLKGISDERTLAVLQMDDDSAASRALKRADDV